MSGLLDEVKGARLAVEVTKRPRFRRSREGRGAAVYAVLEASEGAPRRKTQV